MPPVGEIIEKTDEIPGQTDVRLNSSTRQPASDPRSQTAELQNNRCDVAASCSHSIFAKRLEFCVDQLSPPPKPDVAPLSRHDILAPSYDGEHAGGHGRLRGNVNESQ